MEDWTATKTQYGHWLFSWSGAAEDIFTVWLNGVLLDTVTGTEYDCAQDGYDESPPPLEIVDDEDDAESDMHPPFAILQWREVAGATAYVVEKYITDAWVTRKTVWDVSAGWYAYTTPALGDQTSTQYRISASDSRGNTGTAVPFTFSVMCNPAQPDVEYTIDEANDLVVSEAT